MKKTRIFLNALITLVILTLTVCAENPVTSQIIDKITETVSPGLSYSEVTSSDAEGDIQHSYYFELVPNMGTLPVVSFGDKLYGRKTLTDMIDKEISLGNDVVGGINADFLWEF